MEITYAAYIPGDIFKKAANVEEGAILSLVWCKAV